MPIPSRIAVSISVALSVSSVSLAFADDVVDTLPKVDVSAALFPLRVVDYFHPAR